MNIRLHIEGQRAVRCTLPPSGDYALAHTVCCPACAAPGTTRVRGTDRVEETHDTMTSDAVALCCGRTVGRITVIAEDRRARAC